MNQNKKIFLPSNEETAKLIEDAWQSFKKEANEHPLFKVILQKPETEALMKDMFVSGYCYGHNDCLNIIRGQLEAMDLINDMLKN